MKQELLSILAAAMMQVESAGNPNAQGQNGEAGLLQIKPIVVQDVNRIAGTNYTNADRLTYDGSFGMFCLYVNHYGTKPTPEEMARVWNGGPSGGSKKSTRFYWVRVRGELHNRGFDSNCVPYKSNKRYSPTRPSKR